MNMSVKQQLIFGIILLLSLAQSIVAQSKYLYKKRIYNPVKHLRWSFFVKLVNGWKLHC